MTLDHPQSKNKAKAKDLAFQLHLSLTANSLFSFTEHKRNSAL